MKTYRQCLYEQRLTTRAKSLLGRIERIDAAFDADLEKAKQHELATLELIIDLLSGPRLTVKGWRYLEQQLAHHEQWVDDLETTDSE